MPIVTLCFRIFLSTIQFSFSDKNRYIVRWSVFEFENIVQYNLQLWRVFWHNSLLCTILINCPFLHFLKSELLFCDCNFWIELSYTVLFRIYSNELCFQMAMRFFMVNSCWGFDLETAGLLIGCLEIIPAVTLVMKNFSSAAFVASRKFFFAAKHQ